MIRVITAFLIVGSAITVSSAQSVADQRAAECSAQADAKGLKGEERFAFRAKCKASLGTVAPAAPSTTPPATPKRTAAPIKPQGAIKPKQAQQPVMARPEQPVQGFVDRGTAVQTILAATHDCEWREDGVIHHETEGHIVRYEQLTMTRRGTPGSIWNSDYLSIEGPFDPPYERECRVWLKNTGDYSQRYNQIIAALRALGARIKDQR